MEIIVYTYRELKEIKYHGQTQVNRMRPVLSFQIYGVGVLVLVYTHNKNNQPNLKSKTRTKQPLGPLLLVFLLPENTGMALLDF
jgi:hypothetical protein